MSHSTQANNDLQRVESSSSSRAFACCDWCFLFECRILARESNANHRHYLTMSRFALIFRRKRVFLRHRLFLFFVSDVSRNIKANLVPLFRRRDSNSICLKYIHDLTLSVVKSTNVFPNVQVYIFSKRLQVACWNFRLAISLFFSWSKYRNFR